LSASALLAVTSFPPKVVFKVFISNALNTAVTWVAFLGFVRPNINTGPHYP